MITDDLWVVKCNGNWIINYFRLLYRLLVYKYSQSLEILVPGPNHHQYLLFKINFHLLWSIFTKENPITWHEIHSSANYLIKSQPKVHQFGQILHTNIQKHTIIEGKFCDRWIRKLENWQTIQIYYHLNSTDTHTHMRYL